MKQSSNRQAYSISTIKIVICFLAIVLAFAFFYCVARNIELKSVVQEEIRSDLGDRFLTDKGIWINGERYRYREGTTLLSMIVLGTEDQNKDMPVYALDNKQVVFIAILIIDTKNRALYPIQIDRNAMVDSIDYRGSGPKSTKKMRLADVYKMGEDEKQGCKYVVEALGKLLFGWETGDYISLNSDLLSNKVDYKQSIKKFIDKGGIKDILSNQDDLLITNIKSDRLMSIFISTQSMKKSDIIDLEGEEKINSSGFNEFYIDNDHLIELAKNLLLEPEGNDGQ